MGGLGHPAEATGAAAVTVGLPVKRLPTSAVPITVRYTPGRRLVTPAGNGSPSTCPREHSGFTHALFGSFPLSLSQNQGGHWTERE